MKKGRGRGKMIEQEMKQRKTQKTRGNRKKKLMLGKIEIKQKEKKQK